MGQPKSVDLGELSVPELVERAKVQIAERRERVKVGLVEDVKRKAREAGLSVEEVFGQVRKRKRAKPVYRYPVNLKQTDSLRI